MSFLKILLPCLLAIGIVSGFPVVEKNSFVPRNEFEYFQLRDQMIREEKTFEGRNYVFTREEKIVNDYLGHLKWLDMLRSRNSGFPPSRPIEEIIGKIGETELYRVLRKLPKGGNLHSHEDHQLSKRKLYEIIWKSEDFKYLYMVDPEQDAENAWRMEFYVNPPEDGHWIQVKGSSYSFEDILKMNTLIGLLTADDTNNPTDASKRWNRINPLWMRGSTQLISNIKIKKKYLLAILEQSLDEGITYIEGRRGFGLDMELYELDYSGASSETYGKKFIDTHSTKEIEIMMDITKDFKENHPDFIDYKRISYTVRVLNYEIFEQNMNLSVQLHQKYPQHLIGFDAVAEEDQGYSSLHYLSQYLSLQKDGYKIIPLYLHTAETSWPDDLISGQLIDDPVPTLQNSYESVLLSVKRIGHGKGYVKKPYLMQLLKTLDIAVEICSVSNQILGMEPDLRNHFGQILHKHGVPIVLAPDDPGTFGYDNFTTDWYQAYMGWGLNLGDLKQFANNSLTYTGMTNEEKDVAINQKWGPSWNAYMKKVADEVCERNFASEAIAANRLVYFTRAYPNIGMAQTALHIYGRNFERALCRTPKCQIGDEVVEAIYESNQHLICQVPQCQECVGKIMPISVDLDGLGMVKTNMTFEYYEGNGISDLSSYLKSFLVYFHTCLSVAISKLS